MTDVGVEPDGPSDDGEGCDDIRVLQVDDDEDLAELTAIYLQREREAFDVTVAVGTEKALSRLETESFDCVVSDYDMPGRTGLELLRDVREMYPNLPFILFTGKGSEEIASEAISAGVTDYLQKETGTDQYTVLANRITNAVEHARAEQALRESEQRYRTVVERSHDAIYIYQDEGFCYVNERACEVTGYSEAELYDLTVWDLIHPEDRERMQELSHRRFNGDPAPSRYEARVLTKDDEVRHCDFSVEAISYDGEPAILGSVRDATDHRRTQERYRTLIEHSTDIITVLDPNGTIKYESPSVKRVLGYEPDELVGENAFEYIHPADLEEAFATFSEAVTTDEFREAQLELRFRHRDGSWHWLGIAGNNKSDSSAGEDIVINCRSIQDRKEREASFYDHKSKVEALHTVATDIETCESEADICELALTAAETILDFDLCCINKHVDGKLPVAAVSADAPAVEAAEFTVEDGLAGKCFRTGESFVVDDVHDHPDADPQGNFHAAISVPIGDWGTFQTVTETPGSFDDDDLELVELLVSHMAAALSRVDRERELRRRERELRRQNEQLDEFAGVVSHDLRNPLNIAQGRLDLFFETGDEEHLGHVDRALERIEGIVSDVLTLTREEKPVASAELVDLGEVARAAWDVVDTQGAHLDVETTQTVDADRSRLQRLFENIFRNSVEHGVPDDGTASELTITVGDCDGGFFVADDGSGISPEHRDHVFEPQYSSSPDGTGLGLSIITTVAEAHGWTVDLESSVAGGARFEITGLP